MSKPIYIDNYCEPMLDRLMTEVPWERHTETRQEYFMSADPMTYTYGTGRGVRQYKSAPYCAGVDALLLRVNTFIHTQFGYGAMTACFLNRYDDHTQHLGYHSDNFEGMDHTHPVVVLSFGQAREIWFRHIGHTGPIPKEGRQMLRDGSLLIMNPGFQHTHQHRIPKGDRQMGPRVSLTFRAFKQ